MDNFNINIHVNIGVTQELCGLLSSLIGNVKPAPTAAVAAANKPDPQPEVKNKSKATKAKAAVPAPEPQPEEAAEEQTGTATEAAPETEQPKEYTEIDVRAAMDRARKRIEGENYKDKPDSDGYKQWHRALTGWFKNTAAVLGSDKPSTLPDSESRRKFIAACDAVYVKDNELTETCPF